MSDITKSIGTSSRDYSTWSTWESALEGSGIYGTGDNAFGEGYNDSAFNENLTINEGGGDELASITMSPATGEGHDGTAGTGVRFLATGTATSLISANNDLDKPGRVYCRQIEMDGAGYLLNNLFRQTLNGGDGGVRFQRCLAHDATGWADAYAIAAFSATYPNYVVNCIAYDCVNTFGVNANHANIYLNYSGSRAWNNTVYNAGGSAYGCLTKNGSTLSLLTNNLAIGSGGQDFIKADGTGIHTYNGSSDSSSTGTGALTSLTAASLFVSTVGGSEDLSLKAGASAIGAGTDLGTTAGANVDILGRDRDAEGDVWDMGAMQFVGSSVVPSRRRRQIYSGGAL